MRIPETELGGELLLDEWLGHSAFVRVTALAAFVADLGEVRVEVDDLTGLHLSGALFTRAPTTLSQGVGRLFKLRDHYRIGEPREDVLDETSIDL